MLCYLISPKIIFVTVSGFFCHCEGMCTHGASVNTGIGRLYLVLYPFTPRVTMAVQKEQHRVEDLSFAGHSYGEDI